MIKILRQLFDAVADLPADEQRGALEKLTQDRPLIEQVLRICGHARTSDTMISSAIFSNANDLTSRLSNELRLGDTLDTWKLIEKIGQGGMGSVFLAERADGHFQQTVAIKVMHGLPTPNATARLAQERQILAGLTHPNIARLFDGGATPNGQPYLVLEYIQGLAIDEFCRTKKLDFLQTLDLLLPICDAVAIAHQRLIIHCDIKPSNILVNQAGRPSLLDFGIASLAGEADLQGTTPASSNADTAAEAPGSNAAEQAAHFTQSTMRGNVAVAYTPRYASPEQKANKVISTATDIYSLGRVLEELCGLDPVFARTAGNASVHGKAGLQVEELQAIIDKACAENPAARYSSAQNLASDMKNLLRGAKVEAATLVPGYAGRKWLSQHWLKGIAAMLFFIVVVGFSFKVVAEKNRAELQAANAEFERGKAEAERKEAEIARQIAEVERTKAEAQRLMATQARAVAESAQQETQAAKTDAIKQRDMAEDASKQAFSAKQLALQERDRVVKAKKSIETVNNFLVSIFEGANLNAGGNRNASARDVVAGAEKRLAELKDVEPETQAQLFDAIAKIYMSFGDDKTAASYFQKVADAYADGGEAFTAYRVAALVVAASRLYRLDAKKAQALSQQALLIAEKVKIADPLTYARALNAVMLRLQNDSRFQEAEKVAAEIEALFQKAVGDVWASDSYISFRYNVARTKYHLGQFTQAEVGYRAALTARFKQSPVVELALIDTIVALADTLAKLGKNNEAEVQYKSAIDRSVLVFGAASRRVFMLHGSYGNFLRGMKRFDDAEQQFQYADTVFSTLNFDKTALTPPAVDLAQLAEARGHFSEAITHQERAAKVYIETKGEFNSFTAGCYGRIARLYVALKKLVEARQYAERAIAMHRRFNIESDVYMLGAYRNLAFVEVAEGEPLKAVTTLEKVIALDYNLPAEHQFLARLAMARAWQSVAVVATAASAKDGNEPTRDSARAKAVAYARAAQDIAEKSEGVSSANYKTAATLVASLSSSTTSSSVKPSANTPAPEQLLRDDNSAARAASTDAPIPTGVVAVEMRTQTPTERRNEGEPTRLKK